MQRGRPKKFDLKETFASFRLNASTPSDKHFRGKSEPCKWRVLLYEVAFPDKGIRSRKIPTVASSQGINEAEIFEN